MKDLIIVHTLKEALVPDKKPLKDSISCAALLDTVWHLRASQIISSI